MNLTKNKSALPLLVDFLLKKVISDANNIVFEALLESYSADKSTDPTNPLERIYLDASNDIDGKINRITSVEGLQQFLTTLMLEMTPEEISDGTYMLPLSVEPNYSLGQMVFQ